APILGPDPKGAPALFYALGHYRNGVLFAPATARLLCDWMLEGRAPSSDFVRAFSRRRASLASGGHSGQAASAAETPAGSFVN
ncbi:MAG: hypothetical protein AAGC56_07775, partial [Pseudomonadota bacterium]